MSTTLQNPRDTSTTSLVSGILDDVQDLIKQQVQLTKKEVTGEVRKATDAAQLFAAGGAVLFLGIFIVAFAAVHLIHWVSQTNTSDPGRIPLWACYAIVGVPLSVLGLVLTWLGRQKLNSIHPLHNPAVTTLKDNVRWAKNI